MEAKELRELRGKAIRERKMGAAFDWYDFLGIGDPDMWPSAAWCEGCPDWDDINACWQHHRTVVTCGQLGEDGLYPRGGEEDDDEY